MHPLVHRLFVGEFTWKRLIRSVLLIPRPYASSYTDDQTIIKIPSANGERISAKFYENPTADFTVLFSHGNAEDIGNVEPFIRQLQQNGFSVLSYDYRGYGTSDGYPTEENCYQDIDAAYGYLVSIKNIPTERIIVHGRSLGGGVSVDLATRHEIGGLIMESTFTSASRVLTKFKIIPFDKFETIDKIGRVKVPVLVIHGRRDWTIPFHHGESIFDAANFPKSSFWVETAGHNDLFRKDSPGYLKAFKEFADLLRNEKKP